MAMHRTGLWGLRERSTCMEWLMMKQAFHCQLFLALTSFVYPVFLAMPRPQPCISFPHSLQVTYHASKQWKLHATATANYNQHTCLWPAGTRLTLFSRSCFGSAEWTQFFLMCCVCYFLSVQFGLFFLHSNTCLPW